MGTLNINGKLVPMLAELGRRRSTGIIAVGTVLVAVEVGQ